MKFSVCSSLWAQERPDLTTTRATPLPRGAPANPIETTGAECMIVHSVPAAQDSKPETRFGKSNGKWRPDRFRRALDLRHMTSTG